jgi:septal ring factor EnvC (AmiA/AmiB activator)
MFDFIQEYIFGAAIVLASNLFTYFSSRQKNKEDFSTKLLQSQNDFIDQFKDKYEIQEKEIQSLKDEMKEVETKMKAVMNENVSLRNQVAEVTRENSSLREKINSLTGTK